MEFPVNEYLRGCVEKLTPQFYSNSVGFPLHDRFLSHVHLHKHDIVIPWGSLLFPQADKKSSSIPFHNNSK
jgi:hypothetical protein